MFYHSAVVRFLKLLRSEFANRFFKIRSSVVLFLVFIMLTSGIILSGYIYYRNYEKKFRVEVEYQLGAIADMKINEIRFWRERTLGDAGTFFRNKAFSSLARSAVNNPGNTADKTKLVSWMQRVSESHLYNNIIFLDTKGRVIIALNNPGRPVDSILTDRCGDVLASRKIYFQDFYRDEHESEIRLALLVPVFDSYGNIGIVVLSIDPSEYLYPYIQNWPTPSKTAETLIVRRDGDNVLFLNEIRFHKNSALNLKVPVSEKQILAVKAASGERGVVEGLDYRGVGVIGFVGQIPDSPWLIVARMDSSEVYGPLRERLDELIIMIAALLLCSGAGVGFIWRREISNFYKEKYLSAEALRESETRLRRAETIAHLGNISLDCSTGIYSWSGEVYSIFGVEQGVFIPDHNKIISLIYPEDRVKFNMEFTDPSDNETITAELRLMLHDGSLKEVLLNGEKLKDDSGRARSIFVTILDVTELRQKERELRQKNDEIERFSYTVSHDLKSPLVTIKTFLGYLEKDMAQSDHERIARDMQFMHTAADRMSRLLDELLEMSRIGRVVNPPVNVSFADITSEALKLVAGRIEDAGVDITVHESSVVLFGDRVRLVEIWQNLIENAVKFRGSYADPHIVIGTEGEGFNTVFFVSDNGIGIEEKFHQKVFGLFERLNPAGDGTGLGLTLVRRIVELFSGRIWVESAGRDMGTCFKFTLPGAFRYYKDGESDER